MLLIEKTSLRSLSILLLCRRLVKRDVLLHHREALELVPPSATSRVIGAWSDYVMVWIFALDTFLKQLSVCEKEVNSRVAVMSR